MLHSQPKDATLQILTAPLKDLWLALQMDGVQKVIRMPEIFRSGQKALGVAHIDDREAIVVDLHQKIYDCPNPQPERYLVVIQTTNQLYGVPMTILPQLVTVPESELHVLPSEYRDRDALGIASHMVTLSRETGRQTFFLLDRTKLFG